MDNCIDSGHYGSYHDIVTAFWELVMSINIEEIENAIQHLPQDQLKKFRAWYIEFDTKAWDVQIERDVASGRLDSLANEAIEAHRAGDSTKL